MANRNCMRVASSSSKQPQANCRQQIMATPGTHWLPCEERSSGGVFISVGRVRVGLGSVAKPLEDIVANIHSPSHTGFIVLVPRAGLPSVVLH